jgi:hypothetical protein
VYLVSERTYSTFTIPCVPSDEAYTPRLGTSSAEFPQLKSWLAISGPRLCCPNSLYSPEHEGRAAEAGIREMFVQLDCTNRTKEGSTKSFVIRGWADSPCKFADSL